jgi:thymidylate synthase
LNHLEQAKEQIGRELTQDEKVEYARSVYGNEPWWNINDKRIITVLQRKKQTREPLELPTLELTGTWKFLSSSPCFGDTIKHEDIKLNNYKSHSEIKAPLSN